MDTLIVVPNDKLLTLCDRRTSFKDAISKSDDILRQGVQGITDLINDSADINLDFADVTTVMKDKGIAHLGIGVGTGENKAIDAVKEAISSPLLETSVDGATDVILNISGGMSLTEVSEAVTYVQELASEDANIIFGVMYDEDAKDTVTITVIATGLEEENPSANPMASFNAKYGKTPNTLFSGSVATGQTSAASKPNNSGLGFLGGVGSMPRSMAEPSVKPVQRTASVSPTIKKANRVAEEGVTPVAPMNPVRKNVANQTSFSEMPSLNNKAKTQSSINSEIKIPEFVIKNNKREEE